MSKKRMGRPPKNKADVKNVDLRIPVTPAQKAVVMEAVKLDQEEMATWARGILMKAAEQRIAKHGKV